MTETFEGTCQCGEVSYRVKGESHNLFVCHCAECQKQSSSAFGMALWITNYELEALSGRLSSWSRETPSNQQITGRFCSNCGSRIFHEGSATPTVISIKPGTLHNTRNLRPVAHIWIENAQPWVHIPESCLACARNPPGFASMIEAWHQQEQSDA